MSHKFNTLFPEWFTCPHNYAGILIKVRVFAGQYSDWNFYHLWLTLVPEKSVQGKNTGKDPPESNHGGGQKNVNWLVVWNVLYFSIYWE